MVETKLWGAMTAIPSGIITSILYDAITTTSYVLEKSGKQCVFIQEQNSIWTTFSILGGILLVFFFIWGLISGISVVVAWGCRYLKYNKPEKVSGKNLVDTFISAKEKTLELSNTVCAETTNQITSNISKLVIRELANIIISLHTKFVQHNQKREMSVRNCFRNQDRSSIIELTNEVSEYEVKALHDELHRILNIISLNIDDNLMRRDVDELNNLLADIEGVMES